MWPRCRCSAPATPRRKPARPASLRPPFPLGRSRRARSSWCRRNSATPSASPPATAGRSLLCPRRRRSPRHCSRRPCPRYPRGCTPRSP
ncbi:MAG: hypothetical protein EHM24_23490 [Acidobacteria bacterium]|nr:MAG: hypothetical protein EHM24_23490 [Acidobacteriota bacterium]